MGKLIDMTGQTFGKLTVIKRDTEPHVKPYWICKCECGRIVSIYGNHLRNGKVLQCKYCGAQQGAKKRNQDIYNILPGKHFNHITVIEEDKTKPGGMGIAKYWKCKCDCGNDMSISTHHILYEIPYSCGCMKHSKGEEILYRLFQNNNISFQTQKTFENCRFPYSNALAKYDFYLSDYNILIEFDGKQHYEVVGGYFSEDVVQAIKERDAFKTQWCKDNNIKLVRFTYKEINDMDWNYVKERIGL